MVDDPDEGQIHTYEVRGGTGAEIFDVSRTGLITLKPGARLDFESLASYTLEVVAADSGAPPLADTDVVTINVVHGY